MKRILACLAISVLMLLCFTISAVAQWTHTSGDFGGEVQCFAESGPNLFCGSNGGGVFVSTDNGSHWNPVAGLGMSDKHVHALLVSNPYLLAGTNTGVLLSTNGGANWLSLSVGLTDTVHALYPDGTSLFAGTSHGVYRGEVLSNWVRLDTGFTDDYYANTFIQSDSNLLVGTFGFGVWRSVDSALHWDQSNNGLTKSYMHSFVRNGNDLYVGTDVGEIFLSNDHGHNWSQISTSFTANTVFSLILSGTNLIAGTDIGIFRTSNGGTDWVDVSDGLSSHNARLLQISGSYILASIGDGTVWRRPLSEVIAKSSVSNVGREEISTKNYPNPFSEKTNIQFSSSTSGIAKVSILNLLGVEVASLYSGKLEAGQHSYNWNAAGMPDGMYTCIIRLNGKSREIQMILSR